MLKIPIVGTDQGVRAVFLSPEISVPGCQRFWPKPNSDADQGLRTILVRSWDINHPASRTPSSFVLNNIITLKIHHAMFQANQTVGKRTCKVGKSDLYKVSSFIWVFVYNHKVTNMYPFVSFLCPRTRSKCTLSTINKLSCTINPSRQRSNTTTTINTVPGAGFRTVEKIGHFWYWNQVLLD